jgi:hypothetical protein
VKKIKLVMLIFALMALMTACQDDSPVPTPNSTPNTAGMTPVKVRLTDAPGNFQQVNVDIIGVEFKNDSGVTVNLNVVPGIYNLLDYTNGLDTLIAYGNFPSGILSQVRLILGPNNSVMVDSLVHPLTTPSAQQSGLKLNIHDTLIAGVVYNLLLDFDANQSIVLTGNGRYLLKPVIRVVNQASSGSVHGTVITAAALPAMISVTDGINTYTSTTDTTGGFLVSGIAAGTYTVTITPQPLYVDQTFTGVIITIGSVTEMGAFNF